MQRIEEFKYDAQPKQKHHFIAKEFITKINKRQVKIHRLYQDETIIALILEKLEWLINVDLTQLERVHTKASSKIRRWNKYQQERSTRTWNDEV